jgi:hypothetical protein
MGARGVHFAITNEQRIALEQIVGDAERVDFVKEHIEAPWDRKFLQQTDKAWDAIHRCLSDWPPNTPYFYPVDPKEGAFDLPENHGTYPLKLCVLGGKRLLESEYFYFIRLIEPAEVIDLAAALKPIDKEWLSKKYWTHCEGAWPEYGEDDLGYTWAYFEELRDFIVRMAGNGRSIIFTVDQ